MDKGNMIIIFIGSAFILLGTNRLQGFILMDAKTLFCFSLAAFLFILSDLFDYKIKNKSIFAELTIKEKIYNVIQITLIAGSAVSLLAFPFFTLPFNNETILRLNDSLVLFSLGLAIGLIGLKSNRQNLENVKEALDVSNTVLKSYRDTLESLEKKLDSIEQNKQLEKTK